MSREITMFREAFRNFCPESNTLNPHFETHFLKMGFYLQISVRYQNQYNNSDICWKIWGSNLGSSKRRISSPEHSDLLQSPHSPQLQGISLAVEWPGHTF